MVSFTRPCSLEITLWVIFVVDIVLVICKWSHIVVLVVGMVKLWVSLMVNVVLNIVVNLMVRMGNHHWVMKVSVMVTMVFLMVDW